MFTHLLEHCPDPVRLFDNIIAVNNGQAIVWKFGRWFSDWVAADISKRLEHELSSTALKHDHQLFVQKITQSLTALGHVQATIDAHQTQGRLTANDVLKVCDLSVRILFDALSKFSLEHSAGIMIAVGIIAALDALNTARIQINASDVDATTVTTTVKALAELCVACDALVHAEEILAAIPSLTTWRRGFALDDAQRSGLVDQMIVIGANRPECRERVVGWFDAHTILSGNTISDFAPDIIQRLTVSFALSADDPRRSFASWYLERTEKKQYFDLTTMVRSRLTSAERRDIEQLLPDVEARARALVPTVSHLGGVIWFRQVPSAASVAINTLRDQAIVVGHIMDGDERLEGGFRETIHNHPSPDDVAM
ncbi:MAG TPA: hypothetical protein VJC18_08900, partial [bacterium]|nr:hypothetical protein [bacterium]